MRSRVLKRSILPTIALAVVGGSCATDGDPSPGATFRDSLGIVIVTSRAPSWGVEDVWRLDESPGVDIGVVSGAPEYELYRPLGALQLSDGRIVVGSGGSQELRYYDAGGRHLMTAGRRGGGPGEFLNLSWYARVDGDSVVGYDRRSRRVSVFDPNGVFARSVSVPAANFPNVEGRLADGSYVARLPPRRSRDDPPVPLGRGQDSVTFVRYGPEGRLVDTLGVFLNRVRHGHSIDFMGRLLRSAVPIPFSPGTVLAVRASSVFVATSTTLEVTEFSSAGEVVRVMRAHSQRLPVEPAHHELFMDSIHTQYASGGPEAKAHVRLLEETPPPDSMPAFETILVDSEGQLWVTTPRRPGEQDVSWNVFDEKGIWLGTVSGPDGFRATDIGSDYVLGLWKDDLEVEHALRYRLIKPEA